MEIIGYLSAILIGVSLGLIGGGGSILTVPVFTYLFMLDAKTSTAYSLFVVGFSALVGGLKAWKNGLVDLKTGAIFAVPSLTAVFLTRKFLVPMIPEELFTLSGFTVTGDMGIMLFFALIMILASVSMIRGRKEVEEDENQEQKFNYPLILLEGAVVGMVTGIVGAGGGFLIIPALVILAKLPMKKAVGTSLLIIAIKSLSGFLGDVSNPQINGGNGIEWEFLVIFSAIAVAGIFLGSYLAKFISGAKLKKGFGWFVLIMGVYIMGERISKVMKTHDNVAQEVELHQDTLALNNEEYGTVNYLECEKISMQQSPINIRSNKVSQSAKGHIIQFHYGKSKEHIEHKEKTVQVNFDEGSNLNYDGHTYNLKQVHFHTPSEHLIDGVTFPMEAHMVHQSQENEDQYLVIGVLFKMGDSHPFLEQFVDEVPVTIGQVDDLNDWIDVNELIAPEKHFYHYNGSLTTPPYSETVKWMVGTVIETASKEQITKINQLEGNNARHIQFIGDRNLEEI